MFISNYFGNTKPIFDFIDLYKFKNMTRNFIETLLFATVAINAALLIFIADVLRKMMNAMDEAAFKNSIELLVKYSSASPFMIVALNIPLLMAIPYYYICGFGNWWVTAGLIVWFVAGCISKIYKLPVYKSISILRSDQVLELKKERHKFNAGNVWQAAFYIASAVLIIAGLHS